MSPERGMESLAIRVEGLGKRYRIGAREEAPETLAGALFGWLRAPAENLRNLRRLSRFGPGETDEDVVWALRDVSFEVARGEVVGVIGRNGAGKSTLLKVLTRITEPTEGRAEIHGQVASLLEVGTGFHQELTGRENVYLNGAVLGMSKAEIDAKFDEIVAFSGVERFLDTPIKRYSSGMKVRLAFAVAAHLDAEILLIDEVLAVGDAAFQRKCLGKMDEVASTGRTVLFVSHSMTTVSSLCQRCLYLQDGRLVMDGPSDSMVTRYLDDLSTKDASDLEHRVDRRGEGHVRLTAVELLDGETLRPVEVAMAGRPAVLAVSYRSDATQDGPLERFNVGLAFLTRAGRFLTVLNSEMAERAFERVPPAGRVYCRLPKMPLMPGTYRITATLLVGGRLEDQVENALLLDVQGGDFYETGIPNALGRQGVYVPQHWKAEEDDGAGT